MIKKIISGCQTGADRAALDFAIKMESPHGGWVPKGRLTEDGYNQMNMISRFQGRSELPH